MSHRDAVNKAIKARWTGALRIGGYERGLYQLRDNNNKFDPAGVLCELAVEDGIIPLPDDLTSKVGREDAMFFGYRYDGEVVKLPLSVATWAGLSVPSTYSMVIRSENRKWSFDQTADWIEENW